MHAIKSKLRHVEKCNLRGLAEPLATDALVFFMTYEFTHTYIPYVHLSSHATVTAKVGGTYLETDPFELNNTDCSF